VTDAPKGACSFANTSGGLLVVGVKEKRGPNNEKLKIPDPNDVPGLKPKDWESAAADAIRSTFA
jgi:predicted HTH transcriptional regulator